MVALIQYCHIKGWRVHHSHNEMYTKSWNQKRRAKQLGVSKGFPDLVVVANGRIYFIEMKRTKGSRITPEQKDWIKALAMAGGNAIVCRGAEDAIRFIEGREAVSEGAF